MRIEDNKIFIRQSWLGDALMCLERARLSALHPETRKENDSAMMGTACHTGIEGVLKHGVKPKYMGDHAVESFRWKEKELNETGKSINVTNTNPANWNAHIRSMCDAWLRDIYPYVPRDGECEKTFAVQVGTVQDYELWFEGTMDYFHPDGIWDWKTAARKYFEPEKQSQNIQSSIYTKAAYEMGLIDYPAVFKFGVMIRNASSTGQIVSVTRTEAHGDWIVTQAKTLAQTVLMYNSTQHAGRWLVNDQHNLCSQRWCPVWNKCKGSYIDSDNAEEAQ